MEAHIHDDHEFENELTGSQPEKETFRADESGSLTIFTLFIFMCMFMVAGLAVDVMRFETTRIQVQNTLDRAILAAADLEQTLDADTLVAEYFEAAGLSHLIVDTYVDEGLNYKTVAASTTAQVNSLFLHTLGIDHMNAPAAGTADERVSNVEISLVVDVSGSMGGTKIANLKTAANSFVDTVMADDGTTGNNQYLTHISVVPYNHQTNAGDLLGAHLNFTDEHSHTYCADWSSSDFQNDYVDLTTSIQQTGHFDYSNYKGTSSSFRPECRSYSYNEIQPFQSDPVAIKSFINSLVASGNTSIDIGAKWGITLLNPGLQSLVTNLVSANELHAKFDGRPYDYTQSGALKVMILMTDGMNTSQYELADGHRSGMSYIWYDAASDTLSVDLEEFAISLGHTAASVGLSSSRRYFRQSGDYDTSTPTGSNPVQLTWQQVWEWGGLSYVYKKLMRRVYYETSVPSTLRVAGYYWRNNAYERYSTSAKDPRASDICEQGRDAGIVIYTIGFETGTAGDTVLADCASSPSHFFKASTTDITATFAAIASQINQLKLIN